LPPGITPHSLRHTFTSLLFALGEDPVSVMRQLGHTDPAFTLRVYAHSMGRDVGERERLRALTEGDHGRACVVATGSEKNHHDAACGAEFVVGNSNRRPPGQRPGARSPQL
jgi:hypothetical protein